MCNTFTHTSSHRTGTHARPCTCSDTACLHTHTHRIPTHTCTHVYPIPAPSLKLPLKHPRPGTPRAGATASVVTRLTSSVSWPRSSGFSSVKRSSCSPAMVISCSSSPARGKGNVSAHGDLPWWPLPQPPGASWVSIPMGTRPKAASLHPSTTETWCFSLSGGHSELLGVEAGTGQAVPGGAQLPAPTCVQFSQLGPDLSPGHGLRQTGRPTWSVYTGCPCKHSTQGKNIPISTPASSISQREKNPTFWIVLGCRQRRQREISLHSQNKG